MRNLANLYEEENWELAESITTGYWCGNIEAMVNLANLYDIKKDL